MDLSIPHLEVPELPPPPRGFTKRPSSPKSQPPPYIPPLARLDNPLPPPVSLFRKLSLGAAAVVRDPVTGQRLSAKSLEGLYHQQAGYCCYCCQPMTLPPAGRRLGKAQLSDAELTAINTTCVTRDHLHPRSRGGPGVVANFAAACRSCNEQRGELPLVLFLLARGAGTVPQLLSLHRSNHLKNKSLKDWTAGQSPL